MHANIYQFKKKKHEHTFFTPLISKNDYDKPKVKNIMILYNVKLKISETSYSLVICNLKKKKTRSSWKKLEKQKREKITTQEISNSRRRTQIIKKK